MRATEWSVRASALLVFFLLVLAPSAWTAEVEVQRLPGERWEGLQFLGADKRGRVFVLRAETMEVHRLGEGGPGEPFSLQEAAGYGRPGTVLAAAMGSSGGDWVTRSGAFQVRLFESREEVPVPETPWLVQNVGFVAGAPVAAVAPMRGLHGLTGDDEAPLLIELAGHDWQPLVTAASPDDPRLTSDDPEKRATGHRELRWLTTIDIAPGRDGGFWIADRYVFRLREFSASGRLRTTLTLGAEPEMEIVERSAEERKRIREAAAASGRELPEHLPGLAARPAYATRGLTVAGDGRVYFVVRLEASAGLARWDPARLKLESVPLATARLPTRNLSLAAGKEGLYVAGVNASEWGRSLIPWSSLEKADWETFEETVYLDGLPLGETGGTHPAEPQ